MKKYELGLSICVLLTLTLTMIIIFTGVFIKFFSIDDFTIIAALIGVIGAVIGGVISGGLTLLGVRYTIKHEKDIRNRDQIPQKIELIRLSKRLITITLNDSLNQIPTVAFSYFKNNQDKLYDYASKIDNECYNKLLQVENTIIEYKNLDNVIIPNSDGRTMTYSKEALLLLKKYITLLKEFEEMMQSKMVYYQNELSV
ncbi:hypothetical protein ACFVT8_23560 [Lysinibacillus sp. NPDC058147]|uniref:hypothetical protein n=1 Tax=unclassified Lysinibacillus TaxID=2636778 RepID=UPI0036DC3870